MLNWYILQPRFPCPSSVMEQKPQWHKLSRVHAALMSRCFISKGASFVGDVWGVRCLLGWLFLSTCVCSDHWGVMGAVNTAHALLNFPFLLGRQIDGLALAWLGRSFWSTAVEKHKLEKSKEEKNGTKLKTWEYRNMTNLFSCFDQPNEEMLLIWKR